MPTINDITGDTIATRYSNPMAYSNGWGLIWGDNNNSTKEQQMIDTIWINNKTKIEYKIIKEVIDCTNRNAGCKMFEYIKASIHIGPPYVRDQQEFFEKFTFKENTNG